MRFKTIIAAMLLVVVLLLAGCSGSVGFDVAGSLHPFAESQHIPAIVEAAPR